MSNKNMYKIKKDFVNQYKTPKQILADQLHFRLNSSTYYQGKARDRGLVLIDNLLEKFNLPKTTNKSLPMFGNFFYKKIRTLQLFIKGIRFKIRDVHNLKLLKYISENLFFKTLNSISILDVNYCSPPFEEKLRQLFSVSLHQFDIFLELKNDFAIAIKYEGGLFNLYLFQLYLTLYELEAVLQWFNWLLFRRDFDKLPYSFNKAKALVSFFYNVSLYGYNSWHKSQFGLGNTNSKLILLKLKKKWRFWRAFKKYLLFDKEYVFVKFKWLHNHKRLLNYQYFESYAIAVQSKLKRIYQKKISKARLFSYLSAIEYRVDILSMRLFKVKSIKWIWIFLHFGYLSVNLKKTKKNYVLKKKDLLFGWFLVKNYIFFKKLRIRAYTAQALYIFLEFEPFINSYVCLSLPIKYLSRSISKDRLFASKFIKYNYLKTY